MSNTVLTSVQIATPFLAAAVAVVGVYFTIAQKDKSDRRTEWWRRATWALERTTSGNDDEAETGWVILGGLLDSDLATNSEAAIIEALASNAAEADTQQDTIGDGQ
ncbi:hypothetical protein AB0O58_22085 [Rhodococcus sp. NPDC080181]|uniref:hypothetical protein n=1 Tax=Rhodococcus sp. NPDC080181 TaxID=3155292 RepID=UPI003450EB80